MTGFQHGRSEDEIAAKELQLVVMHEAGHMVVARVLGGWGRALVWPTVERKEHEKAWRGQFQLHIAPTSSGWEVLVGLAGLVAECIEGGSSDADHIGSEIEAAINLGDVSDTDVALIGNEWDFDDIRSVIDLLNAHWDDVCLEAKCMKSYATEIDA